MSALGSVFPKTIASALIAFSLLLIAQALRGRALPTQQAAASQGGGKHRLLLATVMLAWVFLMPVLGFLVSSLAAYFTIMFIADYDRPDARTWAIWAAIGTAIVCGFWLLMSQVLLLRMPAGLLF
jgi:putative tricarboxylic transport membrane protein